MTWETIDCKNGAEAKKLMAILDQLQKGSKKVTRYNAYSHPYSVDIELSEATS